MYDDTPILASVDDDVADRLASRRDALRRCGVAAAALSVPVAFGAMARAAFAQDGGNLPKQVVDVLQFALTLERLENEFYIEALQQDDLIPQEAREVFQTIQNHEQEHVQFIEDQIGGQRVKQPDFDFTAGGMFQPFEDYKTFLLLSQAFEDTGQRAYRGQAAALAGTPEVLTAALKIHSVEARHAARVRRLRGSEPWIPREQPGAPAAIEPVYAGMGQTTKYEVDVPAVSTVNPVQVTEAFDEPLTKKEVLAIVDPFLKG